MDLVFLSLQGLRISRYPGEDAFLSSHKVGKYAQHRFSSCKGFLLPPHPQVGTPVSRKRFARSYAPSMILATEVLLLKMALASAVDRRVLNGRGSSLIIEGILLGFTGRSTLQIDKNDAQPSASRAACQPINSCAAHV